MNKEKFVQNEIDNDIEFSGIYIVRNLINNKLLMVLAIIGASVLYGEKYSLKKCELGIVEPPKSLKECEKK